jgi:hypothetical protein
MSQGRFPTAQWAKWGQGFESIRSRLISLGGKRVIHRAHHELCSSYSDEDAAGTVHQWIDDNYAESMLMGLRRVLDQARGSVSLIRLLKQIEKNHSLLTFDRYLRLCRRAMALDDDWFPRMLYAKFSSDGHSLDPARIQADIKKLQDDHAETMTYINTVVAHQEDAARKDARSGPSPEVTWANLDGLFDDVCALFTKYYDLVYPGEHVDFEPVLPYGFEQAFKRMVTTDA